MGSVNGSNAGSFMTPSGGDKPMGPGMGGPRGPMMNPSLGGGFQGGPAGGPGLNGPASRFMGGPVRSPMKPTVYIAPVPVSIFCFLNLKLPFPAFPPPKKFFNLPSPQLSLKVNTKIIPYKFYLVK